MLLNEKLKGKRLILGSASPRRKELLAGLGLPFTVDAKANAEEKYDPETPLDKVPEVLARFKSEAFHRLLEEDEILVTADTVVLCSGELLGKPKDRADAERMLGMLSGNTHKVITSVCIRDCRKMSVFSAESLVTFRALSDEEIAYYLDNYAPYDKAGSYGIQEWIGYVGISSIEGSHYNVMGLPVQRLYRELCVF